MADYVISDSLEVAVQRNPHLYTYINEYRALAQRTPQFVPVPDNSLRDIASLDVIYPVGDPIFIHIYTENGTKIYKPIEPDLTMEELGFMEQILGVILNYAADYPPPESEWNGLLE